MLCCVCHCAKIALPLQRTCALLRRRFLWMEPSEQGLGRGRLFVEDLSYACGPRERKSATHYNHTKHLCSSSEYPQRDVVTPAADIIRAEYWVRQYTFSNAVRDRSLRLSVSLFLPHSDSTGTTFLWAGIRAPQRELTSLFTNDFTASPESGSPGIILIRPLV